MKRKIWSVGLVIGLATLCAAAETVTIPVSKDSQWDWRGWISSDNGFLSVATSAKAYFYGEVLGQLARPGQTVTITSAALHYYAINSFESTTPYTVQAFRITQDWPESVADPYSYAGPVTAEGYGVYTGGQLTGWFSLDIKDLVQAWVNHTYPNYGVMIVDTVNIASQALVSREGYPEYQPYVTVEFTTAPAFPTQDVIAKVSKDDGLDWRGWHSNDGAWIYKGVPGGAFFYAAMPSLAETGKTTIINSATFNYKVMNTYDHSDTYTVQAFRITEDWAEDAPTTYAGPAYDEGYGSYTGAPFQGWQGLDITNLVRSWVDGTYANYGVVLNDYNGWAPQAIYSREVGYDWCPYFQINYSKTPNPTQNAAFNVPGVNSITLDGDLSDWPVESQWSQPFVYWNGTTQSSVTRTKFTWSDADDMLYVAVETNQANGGHAVVGLGKLISGVPTTGIGATQLCFDAVAGGNSVTIRNEIQYYSDRYGFGWGGGGTDGVTAKYTKNGDTYTYEIALPFWADWRIGHMITKQALWQGDVAYVYAVMESGIETANGTDMTYNGNPHFGDGAFTAGAALTLGPVGTIPTPTPTPTLTPTPTPTPALIPGDASRDGKVDVSDLGILAANYGGTGKTWDQGDFSGDGKVDVSDLGILAAHYGAGTGATLDFNADAKALGLVAGDNLPVAKDDTSATSTLGCGSAGLPLVAGMLLAGLLLLGLRVKE